MKQMNNPIVHEGSVLDYSRDGTWYVVKFDHFFDEPIKFYTQMGHYVNVVGTLPLEWYGENGDRKKRFPRDAQLWEVVK